MERVVLFHVEDPGAANYALPVVQRLLSRGAPVRVVTAGLASSIVQRSGIESLPEGAADDARAILDRTVPGVVVVGTSENLDSTAFGLVTEARSRAIPTVGLVDHGANAAFRFRGRTDDALAYLPDWILVTDRWSASEYEKLGVRADRIVVTGHPHFDRMIPQRKALRSEGRRAVRARTIDAAPLDRPMLVFVSEISDGLNPGQYRRSPDYTLHGRGGDDGRTAIVCEEFLDAVRACALKPAPFLVLRRHPKEPGDHLEHLLGEFDHLSRDEDPIEVVFAADLVAGMSSALLEEAAFLERRVLSIVPREAEREWLPGARSGTIPCATTRPELRRLLIASLQEGRTPRKEDAPVKKSATDACEAFLLEMARTLHASTG